MYQDIKTEIEKLKHQIAKFNKKLTSYEKKICDNHNNQVNTEKAVIIKNPQNQINIFDIANYMVNEKKVKVSNLTLNKLIYFVYAKYLVDYRERLFSNQIQAWRFGPVIPDLYHGLKQHRKKFIIEVPNTTNIPLTSNHKKVIDEVIDKYSHLHPWTLVALTHRQDPWWDIFPGDKPFSKKKISDDSILNYFSQNPI